MFRIGEFSRLGGVTIETLRHYETLGLLKPEQVDPFTGYRYYSARQLPSLNRILALKEAGLSLDQIARILQDKLTAEELCGMLKAQLVQAESAIAAAELRRERILSRLNYLKLEENMPAYEVSLKAIDAHTIAAIRETVPAIEQMGQRCDAMFRIIADWMAASQLPIGSPMTIYHNESYTRENIDTECAFIIPGLAADKVPQPEPPIEVRQVESVAHAASTIAAGDFYQKADGLTPAYQAIARWIEDNHYCIVGAPRELYYGAPEHGDFTAEIQFPVEKA